MNYLKKKIIYFLQLLKLIKNKQNRILNQNIVNLFFAFQIHCKILYTHTHTKQHYK